MSKTGKELLETLPIEKQHMIVAVLAKIIEQQDSFKSGLLKLEKGCSVYDDDDLDHFMLYQGFDYPDADKIREYVETLLTNNIS